MQGCGYGKNERNEAKKPNSFFLSAFGGIHQQKQAAGGEIKKKHVNSLDMELFRAKKWMQKSGKKGYAH
jgi:truncated hemoglobin YjbI